MCVWGGRLRILRFQIFFFFFFVLHVNSNSYRFTVQEKITVHILFITVHSIVHALKNIKNESYGTIYIFKNYFVTVLSVFSFMFQQQ